MFGKELCGRSGPEEIALIFLFDFSDSLWNSICLICDELALLERDIGCPLLSHLFGGQGSGYLGYWESLINVVFF